MKKFIAIIEFDDDRDFHQIMDENNITVDDYEELPEDDGYKERFLVSNDTIEPL